ncbi:hypothetical protein WNY37_06575 [Henriciella sp. AS95]|uniref:hypothetical protein n=1 Tax=Henriciella sp. AS95 TaxID=3135782 RepID=UPI00316CC00C
MAKCRELVAGDIPAIVKLARESGFPARSEAGWHWALFENPEQADLPVGYVAEQDDEIVAMLGTQARGFHFGARRIFAASGHTFISSKNGKGAGFALAKRALNNTDFAAIYTLNNNEIAGRFHKKVGLKAWLGNRGRTRLEWPVKPVSMALGTALSRLARDEKMYARLSESEKYSGSARAISRLKHMPDHVVYLDPHIQADASRISAFDERLSRARPAAPVRSPEVFSYQHRDPDAPGRSALLGLLDGDHIECLMQVVITKPNAYEPAELYISDLEVLPGRDGVRVIPPLIRAAKYIARQHGLARLRLPFADRFEALCFNQTGVRFYRQHKYDCAHGRFTKGVEQLEKHWVPTGFEGDYFFALRVTPERRKASRGESSQLANTANGFIDRRSQA